MRHIFSSRPCIFSCAVLALAILLPAHAEKPKLGPNDLVFNGESFFAAAAGGKKISTEVGRLAKADGVLESGDFKDLSVSGSSISGILDRFKSLSAGPKYVVTDGGGIDLMGFGGGNCTAGDLKCAVVQSCRATMIKIIEELKKKGVKSFIWMCYPDPQTATYANLKTNQDIWAVVAKQVMDSIVAKRATDPTEIKALWVDMRIKWAGKYQQYTGDGIHCTAAGHTACAEYFWEAMKANDYAFFDTTGDTAKTSIRQGNISQTSHIVNTSLKNGKVVVSLSLEQPSNVSLRLSTVSGRTVYSAQKQFSGNQIQDIEFQNGNLASGIYCCEIKAGKFSGSSTLLVP